MPVAPPESQSGERLAERLAAHFEEAERSLSWEREAPDPLLLLKVNRELAGFAISNGDPRACFDRSYQFFKDLYADRHREWDELNLSFVLCLSHRDKDLDSFCTAIETNVFFCRKFTIALGEELDDELARLPFYPIERQPGGLPRPPSAQTLLQKCGVPAQLASHIVQPSERSAERILEDCLGGEFGEIELVSGKSEDRDSVGDALHTVRLENVRIENFRAYRQPQFFDFNADLIVLYGPNGFGKTSLFDAIDFGATGDIGRLELANKATRFIKAACHLDARPAESSVTLTLRAGDTVKEVRRTVDKRNDAWIADEKVDRKAALTLITRGSTEADRIENMVRLFRATHLFSQELQTLTEDFRAQCQLSADVVSRMLAFEDYVHGQKKIAKVLDVCRKRKQARNQRVEQLNVYLDQSRADLQRLQQGLQTAATPHALHALRNDVLDAFKSAAIMAVEEQGKPDDEARGWRAVVEAELAAAREHAARLSTVLAAAPALATQRTQLSAAAAEQTQKQARLAEIETQLRTHRNRVTAKQGELAALVEREKALAARAHALTWQRQTKPSYNELLSKAVATTQTINELNLELARKNEQLTKFAAELRSLESARAEAGNAMETARSRAAQFAQLASRAAEWQAKVSRQQELQASIEKTRILLGELQRESQSQSVALQEATSEEQRLSNQVERMQNAQTELQNLLTQLEAHVTSATCPACGTPHTSRKELLRRLRTQRATSVALNEAAAALHRVRDQRTKLAAGLEERKNKSQQAEQNRAAFEREQALVVQIVSGCENSARQLALDPATPNIMAVLEAQRAEADRRSNEQTSVFEARQAAEATLRTQHSQAQREGEERQRDIAATTEVFNRLNSQLTQVRADAARLELTLETDANMITDSQAENQNLLNQVEERVIAKRDEVTNAQSVAAETTRNFEALKEELRTLDGTISALKKNIETRENALRTVKLPTDASSEVLTSTETAHRRRIAALEELKQKVTGLELAIETAATAAAAAELRERVRSAQAASAKLKAEQDLDTSWEAIFEKLGERLQATQERAVANYTEKYGPLTSVIQRRLRPVTGFEKILLEPEGSNIAVRVARGTDRLPPTDFFSQSQQQTLMLSLFLTACTTQTWSSFAPILLDDPVTHFDDLNAYAFLDLISGLLRTGLRDRQFVVSTCDERLFELARQRFQHLGERAKLFRFVSIGSEGPVIEPL